MSSIWWLCYCAKEVKPRLLDSLIKSLKIWNRLYAGFQQGFSLQILIIV